ncbi:hypothetical protein TTHERM_00388510 (macronuclear) [Tetrahymena thermophila SB210]|uniref:Uncharacterized protein n=1 Tax=Tetrahymena thermophila (strain SB210) TaxID=312017 RepID=Q23RD8_TETTS|nr:hypothetical protein TTHERM_00388510 [Tetrahymena thermophila SB210]EAR99110.2 hypothetical protein TTHERM_00388510 [Tetrahymena thermophila SB210]|eukprot:XP_001019355.2 hypothetical protein TTHERM_00388510 [Tetrahymena thermophila SB210]
MGEDNHHTQNEADIEIHNKEQNQAIINDHSNNKNNIQENNSTPSKKITEQNQSLKISIENFDPSSKKQNFINSPRTLKACEANGIKVTDLFQKTREDIQKLFKGKANLTEEAIIQFQNTIELKRLQKVDVVIKARQQLINQEQKQSKMLQFNHSEVYIRKNNSDFFTSTGFKNWKHQKSDFDSPAKTQSTQKSQDQNNLSDNKFNHKEGSNRSLDSCQNFNSQQHGYSMQHQLQKMREKSEKNISKTQERQKKDILSRILTEVEIRNMKRMNEVKKQKLEENLLQQKQYLEQKKQEYQENREKKEQYRKLKEQEHEEKLLAELNQKERIEYRRQQLEKEKKSQQAQESHKREEQRKKNHEKALLQIQEQNEKHQYETLMKLQYEQQKEQQIKMKQAQENEKRKEISQQKVELQKKRLQKNELLHMQEMEKREEEYRRKQQEQEIKKIELEQLRKNIFELQKKQAEEKQIQIQKKNKEMQEQIEKRNYEIYQKLYHHEQLYQNMQREKVINVIEKGKRQKDKEQEILQKKQQNDQEQYEKFHQIFLENEEMIEKTNQKKEELLKNKVQRNQSAQFIKRFQVNDNRTRLDQMHYYKNIQLQNRLLHHSQRVQDHEIEKMIFRQQIQQIERQNEKQKQEIKEKMEKKFHRAQDININQIVHEFNLDISKLIFILIVFIYLFGINKDLPPEVFDEDYGTGKRSHKMSLSQTSNFYQPQSKSSLSRQTTSHANHRKLIPTQKIYSQTPQGRLNTQFKSQDNTTKAKEDQDKINNFIQKSEAQMENENIHQKDEHQNQNHEGNNQQENVNHNIQSQPSVNQENMFITQQN